MPVPEILNVPPQEAVDSFRAKGYHVGFDWRDTDAETHLRSFTVAKAMRQDILEDVRGAVDASIADGETFEQFRDRLEPVLRSKGWWGQQLMKDPLTGETRLVQLGSARRLRTIFDTNLRTSYARGRWQRIERLKGSMPYLRYVAVLDSRTRPQHRAWHGIVLPVGHAFWHTHYPPNGWYCRCLVQQLSAEDLERYGFQVSESPPPGWNQTREWRNARTGRIHQVPAGIDPGFDHNVGSLSAAESIKDTVPGAGVGPPETLDDYILAGREVREELVTAAGGKGVGFQPDVFRDELKARLARERGATRVQAEISPETVTSGRLVAGAIKRDIQGLFPESWVKAGNSIPLRAVTVRQDRGWHRTREANRWRGKDWSTIGARTTNSGRLEGHWQGTRVHEYVHHLQETMPELDRLFQDLHRRRTAGERLVPIYGRREMGRIDRYIDKYQGKEYPAGALEVITMAFQYVYQVKRAGLRPYLTELLHKDPEMLDLVIGALFRFDP